jgi:hypothetical protein
MDSQISVRYVLTPQGQGPSKGEKSNDLVFFKLCVPTFSAK